MNSRQLIFLCILFAFPFSLFAQLQKDSLKYTEYYYPDGKNRAWHAAFNGGGGLGFRYYFVKQFGINLEWGWQEMSYAKLGFTFQLR